MPGVKQTGRAMFHDYRLYYLYVSSRMGSMRAAADELNLAPSSISRQISLLEKDLKIECIEKGSHKIKLTEAGQALLEYYENRLIEQDRLFEHIDELREQVAGKIWISISGSIASAPLIRLLTSYLKDNQGCQATLLVRRSREVCKLVLEDAVNFGIVAEKVDNPRLRVLKAVSVPICAIVAASSPWAKIGRISLDELAGLPLIMPSSGYGITERVAQVFQARGKPYEPVMSCDTVSALTWALTDSFGVVVATPLPFIDELTSGRLAALTIDDCTLDECTLSIICRTGRRLSENAMAMIRVLQSQMEKVRQISVDAICTR